MKWLFVILGIVANTGASVLLRAAAPNAPANPVLALFRPLVLVALASYGLAFVFYSLALTRLPLNVAYPVMTAGAVLLVGISASLFFKEPLAPTAIAGYVLLVAGIALLTLGPRG